jgi:hypothetical protein
MNDQSPIPLVTRAKSVEIQEIFLGGPIEIFEEAGRKTLMLMINEGLTPQAKVLDIGCGCLRTGYWLIHLLQKGYYYGIEPNIQMLEAGRHQILEAEILDLKKPQFSTNSEFCFSIFATQFNMYLARSIWTHASKLQIKLMLDGFLNTAEKNAVFLSSYIEAKDPRSEYFGEEWIGKSHCSQTPGMVRHSFRWIESECTLRNLLITKIKDQIFEFGNQAWLRIERA